MAVNASKTTTHPYPTAVFDGKASIQDITNPLAVVSVDGGASLHVTMTDKAIPDQATALQLLFGIRAADCGSPAIGTARQQLNRR